MRSVHSLQALGIVTLLVLGLAACDDNESPNAPEALAITCAAVPSSGQVPLRVAFAVTTNAGPTLAINYGDGTTGNDPNAGHTYAIPGSYRFTMNAGSASCGGTISALPPPPEATNQSPAFRFHVFPKPPTGAVPFTITLSGCESSDPDGDKVHFNYDFGDGSKATGACRRSHTYTKRGTFSAQICGSDGRPSHIGCANFSVATF